jgi:hypothetical protein
MWKIVLWWELFVVESIFHRSLWWIGGRFRPRCFRCQIARTVWETNDWFGFRFLDSNRRDLRRITDYQKWFVLLICSMRIVQYSEILFFFRSSLTICFGTVLNRREKTICKSQNHLIDSFSKPELSLCSTASRLQRRDHPFALRSYHLSQSLIGWSPSLPKGGIPRWHSEHGTGWLWRMPITSSKQNASLFVKLKVPPLLIVFAMYWATWRGPWLVFSEIRYFSVFHWLY